MPIKNHMAVAKHDILSVSHSSFSARFHRQSYPSSCLLPASLNIAIFDCICQVLRPDQDVDIHEETFGHVVGWIAEDEYLRYTINVTKDGMKQ